MRARIFLIAMAAGLVAGCSIDPNASWAPDILKDKAPVAVPAEAPPDVRALLQSNMSEFFLPSAAPSNVSFSVPRRTALDWTVCVRASVNGAAGGSIGQQTYLFNLEKSKVVRQEHVAPNHWCVKEAYQPLSPT